MCYDLKNPEQRWKVLKSMSSGNRKSRSPHTLKLKNETITDKFQFQFIVWLQKRKITQQMTQNVSLSKGNMPFDFDVAPLDRNEAYDALKRINTKKSVGPDGSDPYFLQIAAKYCAETYTHIFNLAIENCGVEIQLITTIIGPYLNFLIRC